MSTTGSRPTHPPMRAAWLIGPVMLTTTVATILLIRQGPGPLFGIAAGILFGLALIWILVSVLWPATDDRTCPECGEDGLEQLDPESTRGLTCRSCGFQDPEASSFLLAEQEAGLDRLVLLERDRAPEPDSSRARR